jgi:predicted cupin superfamily sugar epimerase
VKAGVWQAEEPLRTYALAACFVAPGFEFDDFAMMPEATTAKLSKQLRRLVYGVAARFCT